MGSSSKTQYFLIELVFCCLVFAASSAVCINLFVNGYIESKDSREVSVAALECQSVAETIKGTSGDMQKLGEILDAEIDNNVLSIYYDENWDRVEEQMAVFTLTAVVDIEDNFLTSQISVDDNAQIFSLTTSKFIGNEGG